MFRKGNNFDFILFYPNVSIVAKPINYNLFIKNLKETGAKIIIKITNYSSELYLNFKNFLLKTGLNSLQKRNYLT